MTACGMFRIGLCPHLDWNPALGYVTRTGASIICRGDPLRLAMGIKLLLPNLGYTPTELLDFPEKA